MLCMLKNSIIILFIVGLKWNTKTLTQQQSFFFFFFMPIRDVSDKDNATVMLVVQHRKNIQYFFAKREWVNCISFLFPSNTPFEFPQCLFQSESKCEICVMTIIIISIRIKTDVHNQDFTLKLTLKLSLKWTLKWPLTRYSSN